MKAALKSFVLDASLAIAWCFDDESTTFTESILDLLAAGSEATVPAIWPLEVANTLLAAERRNRCTVAAVTASLARLAQLPISVERADTDHAFGRIAPLARHQRLTSYDAAYLELALREGLPFATLDQRLRGAARTLGIVVLEK